MFSRSTHVTFGGNQILSCQNSPAISDMVFTAIIVGFLLTIGSVNSSCSRWFDEAVGYLLFLFDNV